MNRPRLLGLFGCGIALCILTGVGLFLQHRDYIDGAVAVALAQGGIYLLAIRLVWRARSPVAVAVILGTALLLRGAVVVAPPHLSSDIYRYVWDGRVIAAGFNPYRYVPTDPQLAALRDADIFPNINRNNYAPTIYPPVAEGIFFIVTRFSESLTAMKAAMVAFEAVAVALLLGLLVGSAQPASRIVVYAWHPLPLWEFAGSGHIDAAIVALVAAALWSSHRTRPSSSGLALAAATLVKFYPVVLFPALWRRWDWRMPAIFTVAVALCYLPFVGAGWQVFGFLPGYLAEEGFTAGGGGFYLWNVARWLLPLDAVPAATYVAGAALLLAGIAVVCVRRGRPDPAGAALLAGAVMLMLSPHYPWYFAWLIVLACLVPSAGLVWLTLASFLLYLLPAWPQGAWDRRQAVVQSLLYVPFVVLAAADLWRQRRREQAEHGDIATR